MRGAVIGLGAVGFGMGRDDDASPARLHAQLS